MCFYNDLEVWFYSVVTVKYADGIKCWNCIGDSCHLQNTNNDDNIQACHPEDYCQVWKYAGLSSTVLSPGKKIYRLIIPRTIVGNKYRLVMERPLFS